MMRRVVAVGVLVFTLALAPAVSQAVLIGAQSDCRAVGLFIFDVPSLKITAVPSRLEVTFPKASETAREICFAWILVGGDKNDKFEQLKLTGFGDTKGHGGKALFKAKKMHGSSDFVSLEFDDTPNFDPDGDGVKQDLVESYGVDAKFKGKAVAFDPDIIIKRDP